MIPSWDVVRPSWGSSSGTTSQLGIIVVRHDVPAGDHRETPRGAPAGAPCPRGTPPPAPPAAPSSLPPQQSTHYSVSTSHPQLPLHNPPQHIHHAPLPTTAAAAHCSGPGTSYVPHYPQPAHSIPGLQLPQQNPHPTRPPAAPHDDREGHSSSWGAAGGRGGGVSR